MKKNILYLFIKYLKILRKNKKFDYIIFILFLLKSKKY